MVEVGQLCGVSSGGLYIGVDLTVRRVCKTLFFAATNAEAGMINLRERLCSAEGCSVEPVFEPHDGERTVCKAHKREGMVNLKKKTMRGRRLQGVRHFGRTGQRRLAGAWRTRESTMENLRSQRCEQEGCRASGGHTARPGNRHRRGAGCICGPDS